MGLSRVSWGKPGHLPQLSLGLQWVARVTPPSEPHNTFSWRGVHGSSLHQKAGYRSSQSFHLNENFLPACLSYPLHPWPSGSLETFMDPDSARGFCCVLSPLHPFCSSEPHCPRSIDGPSTDEKHRLGKMNIVCPNVPRVSVVYGECRPFLCSRPPMGGSPRPHDQDAAFAFSFVLFPRPSCEYKTFFAFALDLGLFLFCLF